MNRMTRPPMFGWLVCGGVGDSKAGNRDERNLYFT
jgi:hypothetical protein